MNQRILQINFHYNAPTEKVVGNSPRLVDEVLQAKGLIWKIWIYNAEQQITGGIYLFESEQAAQDYLDTSPVMHEVRNNPRFTDFRATIFEVMPEPSRATRAPLTL